MSFHKSPDVLHVPTKDHFYGGDHFTQREWKTRTLRWLRRLYFLCRATHDPTQVHRQASGDAWTIGYLLSDDETLAKSVPLQEGCAKGRNVLDQTIIHAIIGKISVI